MDEFAFVEAPCGVGNLERFDSNPQLSTWEADGLTLRHTRLRSTLKDPGGTALRHFESEIYWPRNCN